MAVGLVGQRAEGRRDPQDDESKFAVGTRSKLLPVRGVLVGTVKAQELEIQHAWASVEVGIRGVEGLSKNDTRVGFQLDTPTENNPA